MKPDRTTQPPVVIPDKVNLALARQSILANGVKNYILDCDDREVIRLSFVFGAGTSWQTVPFSASATLNNLSEGTEKYTAQEIAERLDFYGSYFDVSIDRDWSVITFVCLSKFFRQTLEIAEEIVLRPVFPEEELRVYCDKSKQNITINRSKVDFNARELFARSLFGANHPYGSSTDAAMYDSLSREDLIEFYRKHYTAENCFMVMSGKVGDEHRRAAETLGAAIPKGTGISTREFPAANSTPQAFMPFEGAVQSAIRIGRVMFPRSHPDYIGMQVVTTILGGYFGSRLVRNLREEHGYTYGAYSAMVNFDKNGYLAIATEVASEVTKDAIEQIFLEIRRMTEEPVTEQELALVKNIMAGEILRILDGPFGVADVVIENIQNGVDNTYIETLIRAIREITPDQVLALSRKYLRRDEFTTVVVGEPGLDL